MSLKEQLISVQDIRDLGAPADPALYVDPNYTGTLAQILELPIISLKAKMWAATKFFNERNLRQLCLDSIREAATYNQLDSYEFIWAMFGRWQDCLDEGSPYFHLHEEILTQIPIAFKDWTENQSCAKRFAYARLLYALKWATYKEADEAAHGNDYKMWGFMALQDTAIASNWDLIKEKYLILLDSHP